MTAREERPWPRRASPDTSAGFNIFTGKRSSLENNEGTSEGSSRANRMQEVVQGDGGGDKMWSNRPASTDFKIYENNHNPMGFDDYISFGNPINQDGSSVSVDGGSIIRQISGRPPLDPLLIPRSQANSLIFEGGIPISARRGSPLRNPTVSHTSTANLFSSSPAGSPPIPLRRRASAPPIPAKLSNLSRVGSLQPRVPSSPNTSPWHGRSSGDLNLLNLQLPSPSEQHVKSSTGYYALGTPPYQAPMWSVASTNGFPFDNPSARPISYGFNSFGTDPGQLLQPPIHVPPNRRHTFPTEFSGPSEMVRDFSALNYSSSDPASPAVHWPSNSGFGRMEHPAPLSRMFERFEPGYGRGGNYVLDAGNFEAPPTGLLEDAVREQHFERVVALLEQGFSPNGERGSSKIPPLLIAVSTGNERLVKLLLDVGANVNGCDSRHCSTLHYAAAFGYLSIVDILLVAGANIYAKTDGDLLPVQLATDPTILAYLSARMKSDIEDRISSKETKFTSSNPPLRFPKLQRSISADQVQWSENAWLANNKSLSFSEAGGSNRPREEVLNKSIASGYQEREILGFGQDFRDDASTQPRIVGFDKQSSMNFPSQAVGSRLMDLEDFRNLPSNPPNHSFVHRSFINENPNMVSNNWSNSGFNPSNELWMQDGTNHSKDPYVKPSIGQVMQERPRLKRSSSAPIVPWHELNSFQPTLLSQSIDPNSQQCCSSNLAMLPTVPSATTKLEQGVDVQRNWLQNSKLLSKAISNDSQAATMLEPKKINTNTNYLDEIEASMIIDDNDNNDVDSEDDVNPKGLNTFKKFTRACDSAAPSMIEKFKATSSHLLEVHEMEELSEHASGTPQAPETPRQVSESQGKPNMQVIDCSQQASSSSHNGKLHPASVIPTSIPQGKTTKMKEKKKCERKVTFAVVESPLEEDLALIREDWHEAARAGCIGCGKPGCEGRCIALEKPSPASASDFASCSIETVPKDHFLAPKSTRTRSVRWTRGELLGEGAYGKVFAGLNQDTGELMAVKQLKLDTAAEGQERKFYLAALEREIAFYKTMRHKHIVGYIDMEQDLETGSLYVFLEYVSGGSIQSMLERFGRFSEPLVRVYTRQLLLGLEYLHGKKIVHRDIKGGNVLVDADGVIKLADFGASKAFHDPTQTDGFKSIRGSVFWMAPEVIKGDGYGRRADIWSVGCTVVEMLTAVHPWPGMDNTWTAIFHIAKASSGPPIPEGISHVVKDFLNLCFQLDPKERPTSTKNCSSPVPRRARRIVHEARSVVQINKFCDGTVLVVVEAKVVTSQVAITSHIGCDLSRAYVYQRSFTCHKRGL